MASKMAPKRKVNVKGQPHTLAYINKDEARMLRKAGGSGKPGPSGIPTYFPNTMDPGEAAEAGFTDSFDGSYSGGNDGREDKSSIAPVNTAPPKTASDPRTKALNEVQDRINKLSGYSEKKDTSLVNKYTAKANVMGAQRIADKLAEKNSVAIRDSTGKVVGAMHDGPLGIGQVYTGRMMEKSEYTGPAEFANNVTMDPGKEGRDEPARSGAVKEKAPVESIDGKMPDAPGVGEGGDATDDAKKRSKMGKESTISTTAQGLLGSAKTRNRSLMSGLIQ